MRKLSECYERLTDGDRLTDEECLALRAQFKAAEEATQPLGERFRLAYMEAISQYNTVNDICHARGLN